MKATGIVRRIDDLGRVVIPKELRRTLRIREGDPLEIYTTNEGEVIFRKYSPIGELGDFASTYVETLSKICNFGVCITDRDNIIALSGLSKKEFLEKPVSRDLEELMNNKNSYNSSADSKKVAILDTSSEYNAAVVYPIISEGDTIGSVVFVSKSGITAGEVEAKLAESAAVFLGKHMEG